MIDADLQYPPEAIPEMVKKLKKGADIVVANRKENNTATKRKIISSVYLFFFGKFMHNFDCDIQSGLKVFKKELIERLPLTPSPWAFDLEFLIKARNAGYVIASYDVLFSKRQSGRSKIGLISASFQIGWTAIKYKFSRPIIIPFHPETAKRKGNGFHYKGKEFIHFSGLSPKNSAFHRFSTVQIIVLLLLLTSIIAGFLSNWHEMLVIFVTILTILYMADLLFNFFLIIRSFSKPPEIQITEEMIKNVPESKWPVYTIFCPLYNEWEVVPQFVASMNDLDYPKNKLEVMFLLEEDDKKTVEKIREYHLPPHFQILVVPESLPKTKPKALNFGLLHATGEYLVIYDAEDVPERMQLKKSVLAFEGLDKKTICIQAKLNFYNPHQNLLTRVFTAEYSVWFDLVLTGLQSIRAPIPLGGTSNHFRRESLYHLKGWDSFNVTEDCDLGMRLVKMGYKTAIIDSTTYEEANSNLFNWFNQRTRWIKGYMQTYWVHMRNPHEFIKRWNEPHVITFQLVVGGKILSMFINPIMWIITISYFLFRPIIGHFIESFYLTPIFYMGLFSLTVGNFLYMYYYVIGCSKRNYDSLIKYMFFVPLYWLMMSISAWVAVYKFATNPHHWPKTAHGLHLKNKKAVEHATGVIGRELVKNDSLTKTFEGKPAPQEVVVPLL